MKNKYFSLSVIEDFLKTAYKNKKMFWGVLVGLGIVLCIILFRGSNEDFVAETMKIVDLQKTVSATGQVTSVTDLALSFTSSGIVKNVRVNVGDTVYSGQVLATLDQGSALATLTSAQGSLKAAQARYQKLLEGSSNEEIALAEVSLANANTELDNIKRQQDILVMNARRTLLSSNLEAITSGSNNSTTNTAPIISGTYTGQVEGAYTVNVYGSNDGGYFSVSGISSGSGSINSATPVPLGSEGLFIQFPSSFSTSSGSSVWAVNVPNKNSSTYPTNLNSYNAALETRTNAVSSAQAVVNTKIAELALKRAKARNAEIDLAEADVLSAQGQVQSAQSLVENTILRAPSSGTITSVDVKIGELAQIASPVMVLQDVGSLYVEAKINEANITTIKVGNPVEMTLDAFGPNTFLTGTVVAIDPAAVIGDGIVNYKIKISIPSDQEGIRPGMNANVKIVTGERKGVIAVPQVSIETENGTQIRVVSDNNKEKTVLRDIQTGFVGDGNLVEVLSGLSEGEIVVVGNK